MSVPTALTPLPFSPEPLPALQARLPAALAEPMDVQAIARHPEQSAGCLPEHIFDCEDGIRVIVSVEYTTGPPLPRTLLHVSAAVAKDFATWTAAVNREGYLFVLEAYTQAVRRLFDGYPLRLVTANYTIAVHYWFEWPLEVPKDGTLH